MDILRRFSVNEKIHCFNGIETVYYSGLLDSAIQSPMICYACGDRVSDESFIKYVDEKKMHSIVFPTCGIYMCNKNNAKKFIYKRARKADKKWSYEKRIAKRVKGIQARQRASNQSNDVDLDNL